MVSLGDVLEWKFPNTWGTGWTLREDPETGIVEISSWNESVMGRPAPTPAEIASWELPAAKWAKRRQLRRSHDTEFRRLFSLDEDFMESEAHWLIVREMRAGLANLTAAETNRVNQRQSLRSNLSSLIDRVNAASTVAEVEAVTWTTIVTAQK